MSLHPPGDDPVGSGRLAVTRFHLHLVSDSTGETVHSVARACLVQFEEAEAVEHIWSMVRTSMQMERVIDGVEADPGVVPAYVGRERLRQFLQQGCRKLQVPAIPVLDPVIAALASYLGRQSRGLPGQQHLLDAEYFQRIDAMTFAFTTTMDNRAGPERGGCDPVGVSRTSKTPTCIYLANRGIKAANVPIVPGVPLPPELFAETPPRRRAHQRSRAPDPGAPEPTQHSAPGGTHGLHRSRRRARGGAARAPPLLRAALAGDRRDAPLDRGNGGGDPEAPGAAPWPRRVSS